MKTVKRVFVYLNPYRWALVVAILAMIGLVIAELATPEIVRRLTAAITDGTWNDETARFVSQLAVALFVLYTLRAGLSFLRSYFAHIAGWGVVADARRSIYAHLQKLSLRYYENQQTGQLMSRMVNDSDYFERLISHAVPDTMVNVLELVAVSFMLSSINWKLMLLTLIPVPFIVFGMQGYAKFVRPAFRVRQKELAELNAILNDNLSGIREIKAFNREDIEATRIGQRIDNYRLSLLRALRLMATFGPGVEWASSLGTVIVIYFGGRMAFQGILPLSDLIAFIMYLSIFYQPIRALSTAWEAIQEAAAGADRVVELLDEEPDVVDRPNALDIEHCEGHIAFQDVSFSYIEGEPVLQHIELDIPAGSVTALVGPTGVGKTTMASLIPRFYDVNQGSISIDGHDIRDLTLTSLRSKIAMVLQDVFLFHGTVRDNILFGKPNASEEEMRKAAEVANATEFIDKLPDGYDTMIGERGVKLSGGQKQRISIARAILKDAPILILDEATSSVDTQTELLIQQALERLMIGRTTVIIAHRLSTIRNANQIVVLEGTGIIEKGTHHELDQLEGRYHELLQAQTWLASQ